MRSSQRWIHLVAAAFVLLAAACQDAPPPTAPSDQDGPAAAAARVPQGGPFQEQEVAAWFAKASPEVMALPQTVFADHDEEANVLVFGVEHAGVERGVRNVMTRLGIPASAYRVQVTEPIHQLVTLRDRHRPAINGIQIHFSSWLCSLGFSVDHAGGRSFITNSHCTDKQGGTEGTVYYQPTSSVDPTSIGTEVDDPDYFQGGPCPRGRKCRYSDAARALYASGVESLGEIGRTSGANSGSLEVVGTFDITSQDNGTTRFSGTLNKVGRTTGWTQGNVTNTCVTVNVSGSNITQLCQTLVQKSGTQIVAGGDSGSPVFKTSGSSSAELVGILWGGNSSGDLFVFSPLKNIQDELGAVNATTDGTGGDGGGDGGGGGDGDGGGDGGGGNCPPGKPDHPKCQ